MAFRGGAALAFRFDPSPAFTNSSRRNSQCLQHGEIHRYEGVVTRDGLLRVVLSNELGNAVLYRVQAATTK